MLSLLIISLCSLGCSRTNGHLEKRSRIEREVLIESTSVRDNASKVGLNQRDLSGNDEVITTPALKRPQSLEELIVDGRRDEILAALQNDSISIVRAFELNPSFFSEYLDLQGPDFSISLDEKYTLFVHERMTDEILRKIVSGAEVAASLMDRATADGCKFAVVERLKELYSGNFYEGALISSIRNSNPDVLRAVLCKMEKKSVFSTMGDNRIGIASCLEGENLEVFKLLANFYIENGESIILTDEETLMFEKDKERWSYLFDLAVMKVKADTSGKGRVELPYVPQVEHRGGTSFCPHHIAVHHGLYEKVLECSNLIYDRSFSANGKEERSKYCINIAEPYFETPVTRILRAGADEVVKKILKKEALKIMLETVGKGADVVINGEKNGYSLIELAIIRKNWSVVDACLDVLITQKNAITDIRSKEAQQLRRTLSSVQGTLIKLDDGSETYLLHALCHFGQTELVKKAVLAGFEKRKRDLRDLLPNEHCRGLQEILEIVGN